MNPKHKKLFILHSQLTKALALLPWLVAALCPFMIGCSEEENTAEFTIVRSEITFNATPSKGYITVSAREGFTAQSSAEWCNVHCHADSVIIQTDINTAMEGRTAVITITSTGGHSYKVPVTQYGAYFRKEGRDIIYAHDAESDTDYGVESAFEYTVTPADTWVTHSLTANGVRFHLQENATGLPRRTTAVIRCEALDKEYIVELRQYDVDDLMGEWTAVFRSSSSATETERAVRLTRKGTSGVELSGLYEGVTLQARLTEHSFAIPTHQDLGTHIVRGQIFSFNLYGTNSDFIIKSKQSGEEKVVNFTCSPEWGGNGELFCKFSVSQPFADGTTMTGFSITATDQNETYRGPVETYGMFRLKK